MILECDQRKLSLSEKGFINIELKVDGYVQSLKHVEEDLNFFKQVMRETGHKVALVGDIKNFKDQEKDAQARVLAEDTGRVVGGIFNFNAGTITRAIMNFYLGMKTLPFHLKVFGTREEAERDAALALNVDPKSILIVDDEPEITDLLAEECEDLGYSPSKAGTVEELTHFVTQPAKPRFILMDCSLAGFTWDKCKSIVQTHSPLSRVAFMTGEHGFKDAFAEKEYYKPFDFEEVVKDLLEDPK